MGIRITPGATPTARAELSAYIMAYAVTPAAPGIYYAPDPTENTHDRQNPVTEPHKSHTTHYKRRIYHMNINYIDREANPLQAIWNGMEFQSREPIQADREALRPMDNGREWMVIRYAAMELLSSNGEYCRDEIEEHAAICDERLYLNDFEGYYLDDVNRLDCLYSNVNNRICATVHNDESDVDTYWIVY